MKPSIAMLFGTLFLLTACSEDGSAPAQSVAKPGSDADQHGCIASAGYQWCEATQQCERPWELAEKEGFDNTAEAFTSHCAVVTED